MLTFRTLLQPQLRIFLIPWVKKSSIACSKSRDYGSSGPVRYIPKKSSKINKLENDQLPKDSKKKEDCKLSDTSALVNEIRYGGSGEEKNIYFGEKPRYKRRPASSLPFSVSEKGQVDHDPGAMGYELIEEPELVIEELESHQKKHHDQDVLQSVKSKHDAENLAIKLLATRAFTAVELKKKLHGQRFSENIIESVINDFQSRGLINDGLYAEAFCRSRWSSSSWGPKRIKQALYQKGVSEVEAEKAIKLVFQDEECGEDGKSSHGLSKLSMDHLFVQASKQWLRGQDAPKETRKSRIIRWLQYRGFHWEVISSIVKKLESEFPP
ncbi:uncharacterized protein LOC107416775 isoform X1 [Ziziphus jujuba]|uniref:Regulatory protein RecX n=1 Tax=Ziziphus jujuba TaxID=326968 RepID=A0A6P3ZP35_ZIZJJ|nr:uncharacterized protein LOC107416775 isoform X1 [Ziziphus jujuba]